MKPKKQSPGRKICLIVALVWTVGAVLWGCADLERSEN